MLRVNLTSPSAHRSAISSRLAVPISRKLYRPYVELPVRSSVAVSAGLRAPLDSSVAVSAVAEYLLSLAVIAGLMQIRSRTLHPAALRHTAAAMPLWLQTRARRIDGAGELDSHASLVVLTKRPRCAAKKYLLVYLNDSRLTTYLPHKNPSNNYKQTQLPPTLPLITNQHTHYTKQPQITKKIKTNITK